MAPVEFALLTDYQIPSLRFGIGMRCPAACAPQVLGPTTNTSPRTRIVGNTAVEESNG